MLIKDEYKLKKGDIISWPLMNHDTLEKEPTTLITDTVSPHHVLFKTAKGTKVCINNIDLLTRGIYDRKAVKGNLVPRDIYEANIMVNKHIERVLGI